MLLDGQLYKKLGDGVLAKCISGDLGMEILTKVHSKVCGLEGPTLAKRVQRMGYFWPNLKRKVAQVQKDCEQCQLVIDARKNCFVEKEDWRQHYVNYLLYKQLPEALHLFRSNRKSEGIS